MTKCKCHHEQQDGKENICKYDSTIFCSHHRPGKCSLHDCITYELYYREV